MSIAWNYLDKRSAAMAALKDYCSMKAILATTAEEIANVRQDMVRIGGMRFEESAHGARNPQAGENQILHGIAEIDVLEERKRQAEEFMAWFQPAWDALGEDEKTVLTMFFLSENGRDRGNQRTVFRGAELRLQEEGSRAGALGAAAVWEVKGEEKLIDDIDRTITLCYNKHGKLNCKYI